MVQQVIKMLLCVGTRRFWRNMYHQFDNTMHPRQSILSQVMNTNEQNKQLENDVKELEAVSIWGRAVIWLFDRPVIFLKRLSLWNKTNARPLPWSTCTNWSLFVLFGKGRGVLISTSSPIQEFVPNWVLTDNYSSIAMRVNHFVPCNLVYQFFWSLLCIVSRTGISHEQLPRGSGRNSIFIGQEHQRGKGGEPDFGRGRRDCSWQEMWLKGGVV